MGNSRFDSQQWDNYSTTNFAGKTRQQIFSSSSMNSDFDPKHIQIRESRDSAANPQSTPIIIGSDVTGSMGETARILIQSGIAKVAEEIYNRKPVTDPHIMVAAIGDAKCDRAPLQVTQFEADICLADQVRKLYVEGGGGGNGGETYNGIHLFAGQKTAHDNWEKRRRKGYLFTMGDELCHDGLTQDDVAKIFGSATRGYSARECFDLALKTYEVFHIVLVNEGCCISDRKTILEDWRKKLPQRVIPLEDMSLLAETVVSTIQVVEGENKNVVANSWGTGKDLVIRNAIQDIAARNSLGGAVRLSA